MKKITLKDIAQELNITIGTVSHVINGIDDISEETKKECLKLLKDKVIFQIMQPFLCYRLQQTG